jgi:2-aminoadipate transaminase
MDSTFSFSAASRRAFDSPISDLMAMALQRNDVISLAAGFVDHATLPVESVDTALRSTLGDPVEARRSLQYGTTLGDPRLRHRLIDRMIEAGEIDAARRDEMAHRTVVTNGSQQLLYLLCEALVEPGDIVLVESPTYFVFLNVLRRFGTRTIGIPTDDGGLRIDDLEAILGRLEAEGQLPRVKMVYTISEHSNPSGLSLAPERRPRLLEVVRRFSKAHQILVVEDAAYRGLTFDQAEPPSVWSHDPDGQMVVHARTFSKTFSPGLKVGWGILPASLVDPIHNLKEGHDFGTTHFNQQLLDRVLADGGLDAQIEALRRTYRTKRDAMLGALETHMRPLDGAVTWTHPHGGLYVWISVPEGLDMGPSGPIFNRCLDEGVLYVPGELAFAKEPNEPPSNHARLSYGVAGVTAIEEGIRRLATALAECLDPVSASRT